MSATSTSVVSVIRKVPVFLEAIKIEHAAFTLPFAYLAMLLAAEGLPTWWQFIWVTIAMTAGRTAAMSLNRIIDRHLDSRNPRTAVRAMPQGILSPQFMWGASIVTWRSWCSRRPCSIRSVCCSHRWRSFGWCSTPTPSASHGSAISRSACPAPWPPWAAGLR